MINSNYSIKGQACLYQNKNQLNSNQNLLQENLTHNINSQNAVRPVHFSKSNITFGLSDNTYRKCIASHLNCPVENLRSLMGINEFMSTIKQYPKAYFQPGKDGEHVKSFTIRSNLHVHTLDSDGSSSVEELMEQAANYADELAKKHKKDDFPPFILAITNHDRINDCKTALKLLAANPKKYENIKLIMGLELNTWIKDPKLTSGKTNQFEVLLYGFNPFDKNLNRMLDDIYHNGRGHLQKLVKRYNQESNNNIRYEDLENKTPYLKNVVTSGAVDALKKEISQSEGYNEGAMNKVLGEHYQECGSDYITPSVPSIDEVSSQLKTIPFTEAFMAHPGLFDTGRIKVDELEPSPNRDKYQNGMFHLLKRLKELGVNGAEAHYSYSDEYRQGAGSEQWINNIESSCEELGIVKAGGIDTHGKDLFKR